MKKINHKIKNNQLKKDLWIAGGYCIDFDSFKQFRIIGPNNHLFCGLVDIPHHKIAVKYVKEENNVLTVKGYFNSESLNLYYPAMDDVRTMRKLVGCDDTFLSVREKDFSCLIPQIIRKIKRDGKTILKFKRMYGKYFYETAFQFEPGIEIKKIKKPFAGFKLKCASKNFPNPLLQRENFQEGNKKSKSRGKKIPFIIICRTNDLNLKEIKKMSLIKESDFKFELFKENADFVKYIFKRTKIEIKHLLEWGKTSGDRFGTIFPRDWMEAADLGVHDLTSEVRSYMYQMSLKNVNEKGEGWHEDVVGEYKYEFEVSGKEIIDRKMIDIEPHYLIGLDYLPQNFWLEKGIREKLKKVAKYILKKARYNDFIIFKKLPSSRRTKNEEYYLMGNWRDSGSAFKKIHPIIAPFDVNAVFYPKALVNIKKYRKHLNLSNKDIKDIDDLIKKWSGKKKNYLFKNSDGRMAYALALYDIKKNKNKKLSYKKLKVNHLDESYLYTYCKSEQKEIKSFCERLLSPQYFYTKSGPLIIAKNNKYFYTQEEYHGLVIWMKQTAFAVLGLSKHFKIAIIENWPRPLQKLIKKTILAITQDTIEAASKLNSVPEVYIDVNGVPKLFSDQINARNRASEVQLWSAVGMRRIIRKYYELLKDEKYKDI
ncbi:MAG: hypothetical protein DRN14_03730 [Thermoplasmata archaeon]|nr:MAG: hypothetical protein DRN14_03730 [Thermoplasmata archaeon]